MLGLGLGTKAQSGLRAYGPDPQRWADILEDRSEFYEGDPVSILDDLASRVSLDKASIILTPNGYSTGFVHCVKPFKVPFADLVFTRNFAADRINENGEVETMDPNVPRIDYTGGVPHLLLEEPERAQDAGDSSMINSIEGVLFLEFAAFGPTTPGVRRMGINSGVFNDSITISTSQSVANGITYIVRVGNSNVSDRFDQVYVTDITQYNKYAVRYRENDVSFWVNGVKVHQDNSTATWYSPNVLNKFGFQAPPDSFYGRIKQSVVFDQYLDDTEMTNLTT